MISASSCTVQAGYSSSSRSPLLPSRLGEHHGRGVIGRNQLRSGGQHRSLFEAPGCSDDELAPSLRFDRRKHATLPKAAARAGPVAYDSRDSLVTPVSSCRISCRSRPAVHRPAWPAALTSPKSLLSNVTCVCSRPLHPLVAERDCHWLPATQGTAWSDRSSATVPSKIACRIRLLLSQSPNHANAATAIARS